MIALLKEVLSCIEYTPSNFNQLPDTYHSTPYPSQLEKFATNNEGKEEGKMEEQESHPLILSTVLAQQYKENYIFLSYYLEKSGNDH